jgi:biopolymer transport protein ExbD
MAMSFGPSDGDDEMLAAINTTPLVDVMLVLLIIFLITIPVVTHTVPVSLPKETVQPTQTKPQNITIAIDHHGAVYWNEERVADNAMLLERLKAAAAQTPQPEVHIRGDESALYESVGRVVAASQRAGIVKLGFITQPPARGN